MQEKTWQRIGIGASIVGAVVGLAYLLKKGGGMTVVAGVPYSPTPGMGGGVATQGVGIPGVPGPTGAPGETGATGSQAGLQAAAAAPSTLAAAAAASPTPQTLTQYFVDQFFNPSASWAPRMTSNVPPSLDPSKAATGSAVIASAGGNGSGGGGNGSQGGCGCSSGAAGGGCGGGRCPNQPSPIRFPDGAGSCASTTTTRLQRSMNKCVPDNLPGAAINMMGNTQFGPNPDANLFFSVVQQGLSRIPLPVPGTVDPLSVNRVGPSRFGAS